MLGKVPHTFLLVVGNMGMLVGKEEPSLVGGAYDLTGGREDRIIFVACPFDDKLLERSPGSSGKLQ